LYDNIYFHPFLLPTLKNLNFLLQKNKCSSFVECMTDYLLFWSIKFLANHNKKVESKMQEMMLTKILLLYGLKKLCKQGKDNHMISLSEPRQSLSQNKEGIRFGGKN